MKKSVLLTVLAVLATPAAWADTIAANGPSGAHYANGQFEPVCSVDSSLNVNCTGTVIGGVGNMNATAVLSVSFTGTVQCRNHGGQIVDVKTQVTEATNSGTLRPDRNGQLRVPPMSTSAPSADDLMNKATCPNGNWTKSLLNGPEYGGFVYTLTFARFTQPYISIIGH